MLVLFNCDPKLVNLIAEVFDLGTPCQMPDILKILQSAADFRPVALDLRPNVFQRRLVSRRGPIKFEQICHSY